MGTDEGTRNENVKNDEETKEENVGSDEEQQRRMWEMRNKRRRCEK